mgnify:CR=1 FL=1|tara:strand:- start:2826 stop:4049 length:1224 start_codon:yes stop_codon:yes gene_type:complete
MKIIKIGKADNNDIVITGDSTVSRLHMQMFIDDEANVFVTDFNSTNGTFVNGVKISESVKLNTFDILKVGNSLINWKELLLDDIDAQQAYKTIVDEDSKDLLDSLDNMPNYTKNNLTKKKKKYAAFIIGSLIVFIGVYSFLNSDKQKIINTWISKSDNNLSITFYSDGNFLKDSLGMIKKGEYMLNDNNTILSLNYNKNSLPVYLKKLKIYENPNNQLGVTDKEKINYYGNTFSLNNKSKYPIKIVSATPSSLYNDDELNVNTKIYTLNSDYTKKINSKFRVNIEEWYLVSNKYNNIINGSLDSEIFLDNYYVKPKSLCSFLIISNTGISYFDGSGTAGVTISSSDNLIDVYEGHSTQKYNNEFILRHSPRNWNGNIVYGLMREDFDYKYKFIDNYLEIDGVLYEKE